MLSFSSGLLFMETRPPRIHAWPTPPSKINLQSLLFQASATTRLNQNVSTQIGPLPRSSRKRPIRTKLIYSKDATRCSLYNSIVSCAVIRHNFVR
ncbi:uncharacterized protein BO72DRAFT_171826 [Aspergillus fijiensis CBS 313.89]|uniref:Uncharacterized protein n=1 Tax=Aspergillus fijiensis CBS 313.89 TaxID=1448319 RepID=A0A8G1RNM8_9EURO|nr:uncharacterized protein BO72DRAFT_171826 [Aspergillus fijiensis CBS 313.89]RAK75488.1 hypothetical protein BO72DRAFT_171826 [Aspergillus fijiensis CBS 313.89]